MSVRLYVGNLPFSVSEQDLEEIFAQVGTVESSNIVTDRDTGRSRGFAFVEMETQEAADAAFQKQLEADPQYQADRVAFRERLMRRWAERQTDDIAQPA